MNSVEDTSADSHADESYQLTYLLINPDAIISGLFNPIVDLLYEHDFQIITAHILSIGVEKLIALYSVSPDDKDSPGVEVKVPVDLHAQLTALGPSCLLTLWHPQNARGIIALKGNTRPALADMQSIRVWGDNVFFNLVHCPDNFTDMQNELPILLGEETARQVFRILEKEAPTLMTSEFISLALPVAAGPESFSFPTIANKIRRRILLNFFIQELGESTRKTLALGEILDDESAHMKDIVIYQDKYVMAQDYNDSYHAHFRQNQELVHYAARAEDLIYGAYACSAEKYHDLCTELENLNIYVSEQEKLVLKAHFLLFQIQ